MMTPKKDLDCEPINRLRDEVGLKDDGDLSQHIAEGIHRGGIKLVTDSSFSKPYWQGAVEHGLPHALTKIKQWVGGWILTILAVGCLAALITIGVQRGWFR